MRGLEPLQKIALFKEWVTADTLYAVFPFPFLKKWQEEMLTNKFFVVNTHGELEKFPGYG